MKEVLTNQQALIKLKSVHKLENCIVLETLKLRELVNNNMDDNINFPLTFINCQFSKIEAFFIMFEDIFIMKNCNLDTIDLSATFFLNGFEINNNVFHKYLRFIWASHGQKGGTMQLIENTFNELVNFEDTNFVSKILILNNKFIRGCNLLTKMNPLEVQYTQDSIISGNEGNLEIPEDAYEEAERNGC